MNELDLDEVVDSVLVWDHRVKVGGKSYATRPATVGELVILEDAAKGKRGMSDLVGVIAGLFERPEQRGLQASQKSPAPDVGAWSIAKLKVFVDGYMRFFGQWQKGQLTPMPAGTGDAESGRRGDTETRRTVDRTSASGG